MGIAGELWFAYHGVAAAAHLDLKGQCINGCPLLAFGNVANALSPKWKTNMQVLFDTAEEPLHDAVKVKCDIAACGGFPLAVEALERLVDVYRPIFGTAGLLDLARVI